MSEEKIYTEEFNEYYEEDLEEEMDEELEVLLTASEQGDLTIVKRLIEENDVDPNSSGEYNVCK